MIEEGDYHTSCGPKTNCSNENCVHLMKFTLRRRGQWTHEDVSAVDLCTAKMEYGAPGDLLLNLPASKPFVEAELDKHLHLYIRYKTCPHWTMLPLGCSQHNGVVKCWDILPLMRNHCLVSFHQPAVTFSELCNGLRLVFPNLLSSFSSSTDRCQIDIVLSGLCQTTSATSPCSFTGMFSSKSLEQLSHFGICFFEDLS